MASPTRSFTAVVKRVLSSAHTLTTCLSGYTASSRRYNCTSLCQPTLATMQAYHRPTCIDACMLRASDECCFSRSDRFPWQNIIDRDRELEHHTMLSEADLAAPVYGSFTNGYVYGYIDGLSCTPATMAQHATLIAKQLAVFHKAVPVLDAAPTCFASIRRWLELWPETMADEARQQLFATINKEHVLAWLQTFEAQHSEADQLAFCHNDLLCGNIVYNPDDDAVAFIDYEYSDANPAAFDIANHFNEHCGVAEVDFSAYPDGTFRRDFVSTYLSQKLDEEPTAEAIETLLERVEFYRKVSHLFWGVWAVLQAVYSSIEFDYVKYAKRRLDELTRLDATS
eukprot:TRINITY_DN8998_c0_g1_i3.p1 TRINITY_DN8998_c0_g1~~TRINITY_DN8998_c0_g1_i3.p1  ORF type:complete len:340 (+),score=54.42 TRINITY_DN8998_c0_g1_i3:433-1452(+)